MHDFTPLALAEHLDAALMVAPAKTLNGLKSRQPHERSRAIEWLADHLALRFRHHNITLTDAGRNVCGDNPNLVATELQAGPLELADWQPEQAG